MTIVQRFLFHRGAGFQRHVLPQRRRGSFRLCTQTAEQHDTGYRNVAEGEDERKDTGIIIDTNGMRTGGRLLSAVFLFERNELQKEAQNLTNI